MSEEKPKVFFDWDGTIVDPKANWAPYVNLFLDAMGSSMKKAAYVPCLQIGFSSTKVQPQL